MSTTTTGFADHVIDGLIENADYTRDADLGERHKAFKNEMRVMNVAIVDRYYLDFLKGEYEGGGTSGGPVLIAIMFAALSGAIMGSVITLALGG